MSALVLSVVVLCWVLSASVDAAPESDRVHNLPGWDLSLPSRQYSGFIDIPAAANEQRSVHYVFVEAQTSPETAPLVFWTNGTHTTLALGGGQLTLTGWWLCRRPGL